MCSRVRAVYRITTGVDGPRDAREVVAGELSDRVSAALLEELKLLVSESVTNRVVCHEPDDGLLILDVRAGDAVRCAVVDRGPARLPSGLAVGLLDQLADRWGLTRSADVTQFWFEAGASSR